MNLPSAPSPLRVRDATPHDLPAICVIYAHHVLHGTASFEEEPPGVEELGRRLAAVRALGLPYLCAERDGKVLGYCYATAYRPRRAYRHTVEDSVYIDADCRGQGIGSALLAELVQRCSQGPWRQMVAVVGDSGNGGSLALHRRAGFGTVGVLQSVGFKHGRWLDTVLMQRPLGAGDRSLPLAPVQAVLAH